MFADAIGRFIHPATWAVVGLRKDLIGHRMFHSGTAFAIDGDGHLLTCWHVLFADRDMTVEFDEFVVLQPELGPSVQLQATVVARDRSRDLAILKIERATRPVTLHNSDDPVQYGSSCALFGHPISVSSANGIRIYARASAGVVSMPFVDPHWPDSPPIRLYELDFFAHGGASGGPVFLPSGDVFGVLNASRMIPDQSGNLTRSNLSLATDIREAVELAHGVGVEPQLRGSIRG